MGPFDLNNNGEFDAFDAVLGYGIMNDFDFRSDEEKRNDTLEQNGIDSFDFALMDDSEKTETLEDAGLDPFDFDL